MSYTPEQGDVIWVDFIPQAGREQAGRRPALILSPVAYNQKIGLAVFCPITTQQKGYPFEVLLPESLKVQGVVLADHVKSMDWRARKAVFLDRAPREIVREVLLKLNSLLRPLAP